jgi:hypothetical protein
MAAGSPGTRPASSGSDVGHAIGGSLVERERRLRVDQRRLLRQLLGQQHGAAGAAAVDRRQLL